MKICISGPSMAGKTYFINTVKHARVVVIPESARTIHSKNPELVSNIDKFRHAVFHHQLKVEQELRDSNTVHYLFDRGILDNLAFYKLFHAEDFKEQLENIKYAYQTGIIKPYDRIYYFNLHPQVTDLIKRASEDPLRRSTINTEKFQEHVYEFKNAFFQVARELDMLDRISVITAMPDELSYNTRNSIVFKEIFDMVTPKWEIPCEINI